MPFRLDGTAISIQIQLNGVPVDAALDSVASSTHATEADARRAGVTPDTTATDRVIHPNGMDGYPVEGRLHRFASLEIGAERYGNLPMAVTSSAAVVTLLGDDFRLNRVWISYPRRMLFIQPALGNPVVHMVAAGAP